MPNIRVVRVTFSEPLKLDEVPYFRGAVVSIVGIDNIAYHNHIGDDKFQYSYPLIQYQIHDAKAGFTSIQAGTEEVHHFFTNNIDNVRIGKRECRLLVENVQINRFQVQVTKQPKAYRIDNWLPLNEVNYVKYIALPNDQEKLSFLQRVLVGNILSFAKGIEWTVEGQIEVTIPNLPRAKAVKRKSSQLLAFDIEFMTNVELPLGIGLGKSVSVGFGVLSKI